MLLKFSQSRLLTISNSSQFKILSLIQKYLGCINIVEM